MRIEIRRLTFSFTGLGSQGSPAVPAGTVARKDSSGARQAYARAGLEAEALANEKLVQAGRMATLAMSGRGPMLQRRDAAGGDAPTIADRIGSYLTTQASGDLRVRLPVMNTGELVELVRKSVSGADLLRESALQKIVEDWHVARTPSLTPTAGAASTPGSLPGGPPPGGPSPIGGRLGDFGRLLGRIPTSVLLGDTPAMELTAGRSGLQLSHERPGLTLSAEIGWDRVLGAEAAAGDLKFTAAADVLGGEGQKLTFGLQYGPDAPDLASLPRAFQPAGQAAGQALVNLPRFVSYMRGVDELKSIPDAAEQARRIAGERDRKIPFTVGLTAEVNRGGNGPPGVSVMGNLTLAWDVLKKSKARADSASESPVAIPRGGGRPLDATVLEKLEGFFGRELPQVRIHTGTAAEAAAAGLKAEAFTLGRDIYFGKGKFAPDSKRGLGLLGHELTHVLQQQEGRATGVRRAGADTGSLEREADSVARAVQTASNSVHTGSLIIGTYRRTYRPTDGQPLANTERTALDTIATRGREACEWILQAENPSVLTGDRALPGMRMSFEVDLASVARDAAAQAWGRKMAETIVAASRAQLASRAHPTQAVQLAPNPNPSDVKAEVELVKRMLAISDYEPSMKSAIVIVTHIATQKPEMANAIFCEIQNWTIDGKTGPAVLQMIMGPLDESPTVARAMRELLLKRGITAFSVGRTQLSPQEKAGLARLAGANTTIVSKIRGWQEAQKYTENLEFEVKYHQLEDELTALLPATGVSSIDALVKLVDDLESQFRARAKLVALRMLDDNESLVLQEAARYTGAKGEVSELVKAAKELSQLTAMLSQTEQHLGELNRQAADPMGGGMGIEGEYDRLSGIADEYRKELEILTNLYSLKFPVLKAQGLDVEALAKATPEQARKLVLGKFHEVLENIAKTRRNINEGDLDAWALAPVVEATKEELGIKGTPLEEIGDDAAARARGGSTLRRLGLAALAIGLGLVAAIPTGGSSLAAGVATAATVAGVGLTVYGISESVEEYRAKSAARHSALDPALAISQEDPSLFWLGVDIVAGIIDLGMAYKALKGIGAVAKEVQAGKASVEAVRQEAQRAAKMANAEGKLRGSEEEFVKRIVNRVETQVGTGTGKAATGTASEAEEVITIYRGTTPAQLRGLRKPGAHLHDLGEGTYFTFDHDLAITYATMRAGKKGADEVPVIIEATVKKSDLGRVLDVFNPGPERQAWETFLDSIPNGRQLANIQENYSRLFEMFVETKMGGLDKFDAIIGRELVRDGSQLSIRTEAVLEKILGAKTTKITPVSRPVAPPTGGGAEAAAAKPAKTQTSSGKTTEQAKARRTSVSAKGGGSEGRKGGEKAKPPAKPTTAREQAEGKHGKGGKAATTVGGRTPGAPPAPALRPYVKSPQADFHENRIGEYLNQKAQRGQLAGVQEVRGAKTTAGARSGDYRFIHTDGSETPADLLRTSTNSIPDTAPIDRRIKSIQEQIYKKSGQAQTVIVELEGKAETIGKEEARQMARAAVDTPPHSPNRVIVIKRGTVIVDVSH